ncbi:MAG: hypothetical protein EYC69_14435 [Bacteroidetes bacterium]|nr:MAG: hypothetical protein EYC69_14435 [Bacteroidota bacterium]
MSTNDYRIFPDPNPSDEKKEIDKSGIKDDFIIDYNEDGSEMMSFRKSFIEVKNVNIDEIISKHPAVNFTEHVEEDKGVLRKKYIG